jgi:4-hydroxy-tetrahydrodipicolinate synthase
LYQHYRTVAEAVDIDQILYNVPGRTGVDISNDTTLRLAAIPNIVGIKDATGSIERGADLIIRAPKDFAIYSGDDASGMALMLIGGKGVISVTANVAPKLMHEMCIAAMTGKIAEACAINAKLFPLHQKLFVESNPIPVKWVLNQMGLIGTGIRLPLVPLSESHHQTLLNAMKSANIPTN